MADTAPNLIAPGTGGTGGAVPENYSTPWSVVISVSVSSLKRRRMRAFVAMLGVILAIAFLAYMLINHAVIHALIAVESGDRDKIGQLLNQAGIDKMRMAGTDTRMFILISLSLLTCLVGIINAMLMSVTERVKEIGTLKCVGALNSFIVKTYFIESLFQGVAATIAGIILGVIFGIAASIFAFGGFTWTYFPVLNVLGKIVLAFGIGTTISIVASIAPAYWAAQKQPVEALRVEE
jgi:putative ABC transport system permease protein